MNKTERALRSLSQTSSIIYIKAGHIKDNLTVQMLNGSRIEVIPYNAQLVARGVPRSDFILICEIFSAPRSQNSFKTIFDLSVYIFTW